MSSKLPARTRDGRKVDAETGDEKTRKTTVTPPDLKHKDEREGNYNLLIINGLFISLTGTVANALTMRMIMCACVFVHIYI